MSFGSPPWQRWKQNSLLASTLNQIQLVYYRYEVTSPAYVLTPMEKIVFNFIITMISLLLLGAISYLPPLVIRVAMGIILSTRNDDYVNFGNNTLWVEQTTPVAYSGVSRTHLQL